MLASLEDGSGTTEEADADWEHEVHRRVDKVESGAAKLIAAKDVYAETHRIYQK